MSYQDIIYDKSERVATLTFNRPERLNAITNVMRSEILEAIKDASEDDDIRVVVIKGAGKGFCAGADLAGSGTTPARRRYPTLSRVGMGQSTACLPSGGHKQQ